MRFLVRHESRFRYSEPVFLEPHEIRLRPRCDSCQRLVRYALSVEPKPSVLTQTVDADGNDVAYAWFEEPTDSLEIATDFAVDTLRDNPFDFLALGEGAPRLPIAYPAGVRERLAAELCSSEADARAIEGLVLPLVEQGLDDPTAFLGALNRGDPRALQGHGPRAGRPPGTSGDDPGRTGRLQGLGGAVHALLPDCRRCRAVRQRIPAAGRVTRRSLHARMGRSVPAGRGLEGIRSDAWPQRRGPPHRGGRVRGPALGGADPGLVPGRRRRRTGRGDDRGRNRWRIGGRRQDPTYGQRRPGTRHASSRLMSTTSCSIHFPSLALIARAPFRSESSPLRADSHARTSDSVLGRRLYA